MTKDHWTPNAGGVCDECGEPRFAHGPAGECPTDAECEQLRPRLDRWHETVLAARDAYQHARKRAKDARNLARKGRITAAECEASQAAMDQALVAYRSAIRQADREA